jgi:hypothetical protein
LPALWLCGDCERAAGALGLSAAWRAVYPVRVGAGPATRAATARKAACWRLHLALLRQMASQQAAQLRASATWAALRQVTLMPRRGWAVSSPSWHSSFMASRTGVRLTPNSCASAPSLMSEPGGNWWLRMRSRSLSAMAMHRNGLAWAGQSWRGAYWRSSMGTNCRSSGPV